MYGTAKSQQDTKRRTSSGPSSYRVRPHLPGCLSALYRNDAPNKYDKNSSVWEDGFWDRCRDWTYDDAGRAIKDNEYAYVNFSVEAPNLATVSGVTDDREYLSFYGGGHGNKCSGICVRGLSNKGVGR